MQLPYELRIGVTGHRNIDDPAAVGLAVDGVLGRIAATLNQPGTALAVTVVSPLAGGSDQIVARSLLDGLHARLEVVTPFALAEYRRDFERPEDRVEFDRLLAQAAVVDELPGVIAEAGATAAPAAELRDAAYCRVGERVVDACEILIAVWNGRRAAGPGGTADILEHALRRERLVVWIHAERPQAAPRIIRRITYDDVTSGDQAIVEADEFPSSAKALSLGYHQQSAYVNDRSIGDDDVRTRAAAVSETLTRAAAAAGLPQDVLGGILDAVVPEFVRADALALRYQRRHIWVVNGILRLAAAAVTVAVTQVLLFPEQLWLIVFEIAAMVIVFGLWWGSRRGTWHEKWLHDRYLAEQLRAAMFTVLAGARDERNDDRALTFFRGPKHWLSHTAQALSAEARRRVPPLPLEPLRRLVAEGWLQDQQAFHARNARRKTRQAARRHQLGFGLFGATLLMALLHMLDVGHGAAQGVRDPALWITFFALVLPVWAGAVHAITSQLELERVAERSARMASALAGLAQRANRALTHDELSATACEASALMLRETHEWWVLLSFQDVRLHV